MNNFLIELSNIIENNYIIAPIICLLAGILTSLAPCNLASVPLVIGYVGQTKEKSTKESFKLSCLFALGTSITYTTIGVIAALFGKMLSLTGNWIYLVVGIFLIIMALQFLEIIDILPTNNILSKNKKQGYVGALIAGLLAGFFSSACSTPVLLTITGLVTAKGSLLLGIILFLCYSIGHSILIVVSGTSIKFVEKVSASPKYNKFNQVIKISFASIMLLLAFYLIYIGL